jgi:hypothetical protein
LVTGSLINIRWIRIVGCSKFSLNDPFKPVRTFRIFGFVVTGLAGTLGSQTSMHRLFYLRRQHENSETVKPIHEAFASDCRLEAFSFGSIRMTEEAKKKETKVKVD